MIQLSTVIYTSALATHSLRTVSKDIHFDDARPSSRMLYIACSQQAEIFMDFQIGLGQILTIKISDICGYISLYFLVSSIFTIKINI